MGVQTWIACTTANQDGSSDQLLKLNLLVAFRLSRAVVSGRPIDGESFDITSSLNFVWAERRETEQRCSTVPWYMKTCSALPYGHRYIMCFS